MIEIVLSDKEWVKFTAEAKKRMRMKGWSNKKLAESIGKNENSVSRFFAKNCSSRFMAAEIANVLGMKRKDWK